MPCTQVYPGASVATEAREFIYSLGCMFGSQLTPTTNPYLNFTAGGGLSPFASLQAQVRGWNELLLATFWFTPTQVLFRVTRLWADRSLGARFADVCLAIGFVSRWPGTPSPILSV